MIDKIVRFIPTVKGPSSKLGFAEKLKWTGLILLLFFLLGQVQLYGLGANALEQFEFLSVILGASFGNIISLGIGPLVTGSIILQLLLGTGLLSVNTNTPEGRKKFQDMQKVAALAFVIIEAFIYVFMGGLSPDPNLIGTPQYLTMQLYLVAQLMVGGLLIMLMDDVISKWGFGSGISLFIVANVGQQLSIRLFNFMPAPNNPEVLAGAIPSLFQFIFQSQFGDPGKLLEAGRTLTSILVTVAIFAICVYCQSMKVEIPLSMGRVRGNNIRWPLNFFYTSNIPVILVAALMANVRIFGMLLERWGIPILGTFSNGSPISGFAYYVSPPDVISALFGAGLTFDVVIRSVLYMLIFMLGGVMFSIFWMQSAGMDPLSQARQIMNSGLQIQGFRRDERVLERLLSRYIWPLTIVGGASVGLLAALADLLGALSNGTGILLAVMIVYKLYEEIAKQHMMDMHPAMRKFME